MKLAPRDAKTFKQVCSLRTDNRATKDGWIMVTGENRVVVVNQRTGEPGTGEVTFSLGQFRQLVDWFNTPQETMKRPKDWFDR